MEGPVRKPAVPPKPGGNAIGIKEEGEMFLHSLLSKNLVVSTTDGRMFRGQFKCTDPDYNIVLAHTDEYRQPTARQIAEQARQAELAGNTGKVAVNMVSRYLGLVVVPGNHVVKVEVEQFLSQMRR
ncbi:lsm domain containing protein [Grosmannia clavigera kw1407]|uniref:Lsm domain containing protein n=1 Tax=Grosmannia clavigera (strain kw1407 / UAMH 11150) TaxID=655863 RepID=F0XU88_GROCL|nr:lsm domain containing protein [Grosmannia clavigera kw1407]EFW98641.1 lsm domain containing protein [Grosmannia clavigera kw1407]